MRRSQIDSRIAGKLDTIYLTKRELQVLRLICRSMGNLEIGLRLSISRRTVKVYVSAMLTGFKFKSRVELVIFVFTNPSILIDGVCTVEAHREDCPCASCLVGLLSQDAA